MRVVGIFEMSDKQSQQRRGRADGTVATVADRSAVEENRALAPQATQTPQGWSSIDRQPSCAGRHSVDAAERCALAGPAARISASLDVLAAVARLGRAGRLAEYLAAFLSELNEREELDWSESFLDGSFAPAKKGAQESAKPSGARARSGWWWSTARVFLWETSLTRPPRRKSGSRKRRSHRSA